MGEESSYPADTSTGHRIRAFAVHILTALGAACALFALLAAAQDEWATMFLWLGTALVIDGVDGTLARRFDVAKRLPRWSGDVIDIVVDFTTYVFVPAFALARSGLLPEVVAVPLSATIVVSSAIYFADRRMKTADNYFHGFPVLWNAVAFHLFVIAPSPWAAAGVTVLFVVLTFVPLNFIHPVRVTRFRALNIAVLVLWSLLAVYATATGLEPGAMVAWPLTAAAIYLVAIGLVSSRT
jgi:phosphatidylcholine synthase